jgi:hypothetical protein
MRPVVLDRHILMLKEHALILLNVRCGCWVLMANEALHRVNG